MNHDDTLIRAVRTLRHLRDELRSLNEIIDDEEERLGKYRQKRDEVRREILIHSQKARFAVEGGNTGGRNVTDQTSV